MPLSNAGLCRAWLLSDPAEYAVSRGLFGAAAGWGDLPTRGEALSPGTAGSDGQSPLSTNGVRASSPYGLNGNWMWIGRPSACRPCRTFALRGSGLKAGPNAGYPSGVWAGNFRYVPKPK